MLWFHGLPIVIMVFLVIFPSSLSEHIDHLLAASFSIYSIAGLMFLLQKRQDMGHLGVFAKQAQYWLSILCALMCFNALV
jgi:hypothetical protein